MRSPGDWLVMAATVAAMTVGAAAGTSNGAPTTPAPTPALAATEIDSLLVPPDPFNSGLEANTSWGPVKSSIPCDGAPDGSRPLFAPGALARRDVRYSGPSNVFVIQHLAVYPSDSDALSAFSGLVDTARECLKDPFDTDNPDRIAWHHMSFSPVSGGDVPYSTQARVVDNVVLAIEVGILSPTVGTHFADTIQAKIQNQN